MHEMAVVLQKRAASASAEMPHSTARRLAEPTEMPERDECMPLAAD